ncbi:aspartate kinase [Candidatus Bathyarchaeota archaeon]|nr:MAG: aspartate kinase [Candidatus Bathyarchaeota archaeon]
MKLGAVSGFLSPSSSPEVFSMVSGGKVIVAKFGGKTLLDGSRVRLAAEMVVKAVKNGLKPVVVVSAIGHTTDDLIKLAREASEDRISPENLDDILSMGERTSARVFASVLKAFGLEAVYLDPCMDEWPILTNDVFGNAEPILPLTYERIRRVVKPLIEKNIVPVIPGFIGKTLDGRTTTLGRGGSDITALLVGKALDSERVVLVSNVDGIMTGDPKVVSNPKVLKEIDVKTLAGLADSDVKFIKKKTLKYKPSNISVKLISFKAGSLDAEGTTIKGSLSNPGLKFDVEVCEKNVAALTVVGRNITSRPEVLAKLLKAIGECGLSPLGISTDSDSIILYIPEAKGVEAAKRAHSVVLENQEVLIAVALKRKLSMVKVKGLGLEETPGIIFKISGPLKERGMNIHGMLTITSSVVVILDRDKVEEAAKLIDESLNRSGNHG